MALKIIPQFKMSDIEKYLNAEIKKQEKAIQNRMIKAGKIFVNNARINGGYQNQTHNLVSSIAFVVLKEGEIIHEDYKQIGPGSEGVNTAKRIIEEQSANFSRGYALVCVAGMDYAAHVESKGKDVISGSSTMIQKDLKSAFKQV